MPLTFWTGDFFKQAVESLNGDAGLARTLGEIQTSILLKCLDRGDSFLVQVASGSVSVRLATPGDRPEFTLSAPYDEWVKIAKGEEKVQREIVRGRVKFTGSWSKMLLYINKAVRLENEMLRKMNQMSVTY
jgi:putative sterol carrier protein